MNAKVSSMKVTWKDDTVSYDHIHEVAVEGTEDHIILSDEDDCEICIPKPMWEKVRECADGFCGIPVVNMNGRP